VERRRFEHLFVELSVALGELAPRYALWLRVGEFAESAEALDREAAVAFCREGLQPFLAEHDHSLSARQLRRLVRVVSRYDPLQATAEEQMSALFGRAVGEG
jgi:hypothetical protein